MDATIAAEVDADSRLADQVKASSTPTCFINGQPVRGAKPFSAFKTLIDQEIEAANLLIEAGTALDQVYEIRAKSLVATAS